MDRVCMIDSESKISCCNPETPGQRLLPKFTPTDSTEMQESQQHDSLNFGPKGIRTYPCIVNLLTQGYSLP